MTLRVMHVIEAMRMGGAESLVIEHVRHAGPGVASVVCAINRGGPALEAVRALGARGFVIAERAGGRFARGRALAAVMRDEGVTVVNGHNPTGALYATAAGALARVPVQIRTEHSIHYPGRHSSLYTHAIEPMLTARADRVICVCEAARASHAPRFGGRGDKFVVVRNGISSAAPGRPRDAVRAELGLRAGDRVALTVGSLTRQKAQHRLLEGLAAAAARIPDAVLLIAGDGPLRDALEARARDLGVTARVRWLGARGDVADLIEAADVFVLSSIREGLSVTLLEAMRAGRAAIATDVGGNAEAVVHGETGLVVPPEDPAALGEALADLLGDPARAARLGHAARERWARCFTAERMVRETEEIYRAALERAGVRVPLGTTVMPERHATP